MHPQTTCETKLIPRGLVVVNWTMVLVGTTHNYHIHRWSFSIPTLSSYTNDVKAAGDSHTFTTTNLEVDGALWNEDFIPCGILSFGLHEHSSHLQNVSSYVTDLHSTLTALRATGYVILLAFSQPVWYSLFAILVLISILLHAVLRREEAVVHAGSEAPPWETSEVLLATIGAICQQGLNMLYGSVLPNDRDQFGQDPSLTGSHRHPDTAAARTIFMCLFVLSVIMYTAFSAAFVALLSPPIHHVHHDDRSHGILRHEEGKFPALHLMSDLLKSNLTICTSKIYPYKPALSCSFQIHSKDENSILDAKESEGTSDNHQEEYDLNFDQNNLSKTASLTMKDAYPAFLLLASGTIAAVALLIIEVIQNRRHLDNKDKLRRTNCFRKSVKPNSKTSFIHKRKKILRCDEF